LFGRDGGLRDPEISPEFEESRGGAAMRRVASRRRFSVLGKQMSLFPSASSGNLSSRVSCVLAKLCIAESPFVGRLTSTRMYRRDRAISLYRNENYRNAHYYLFQGRGKIIRAIIGAF